MDVAELVTVVDRVRATTKKSDKIRLLAECLKQTRDRDAELAALYLTGALPQGKVGVGWSVIQKAVPGGEATGEPLTLRDVDRTIDALAAEQGAGSTERRIAELGRLLIRATPDERRFLSQLLIGDIRQGALEGLLIDAIATAAGRPSSEIRQACMFASNIGEVARVALQDGATGLSRFSPRLFHPIMPMLADSAEDVEAALERLDEAAWEYKLDGARIQVHKGGNDVRLFTRQLQDVTERLPDIVEWARTVPARDAVLDGEAIALHPDGRPQAFQTTMRRLGRQKDVERLRAEIPLSPFVFDVLLLDGESTIGQPYRERSRLLNSLAPSAIVPRMETKDPEQARRFFTQALDAGHEGIMAKSLVAPYAAGQRGSHWLKLKQAVSLDLVVLAAEWGNGRREGWLSNLHLGARDPESGRVIMLGKTFKGLTDDMLRWQTEQLLSLETRREGATVFVRPALIVEVAFSDVQRSPRYPAGLALRFARVKRYRPDKTAEQADTIQTVAQLYRNQPDQPARGTSSVASLYDRLETT